MYRIFIIFLACAVHLGCEAQDASEVGASATDAQVADAAVDMQAPALPACFEREPVVYEYEVPAIVWADDRFLVMGWSHSERENDPPILNLIEAVSTDGAVLWTQRIEGLRQVWAAAGSGWVLTRTPEAVQISRIGAEGALTVVAEAAIATSEFVRVFARPDGRAGWLVDSQARMLWRIDAAGVRAVDAPDGYSVRSFGVLGPDETLYAMLANDASYPAATDLGSVTPAGEWTVQPVDLVDRGLAAILWRDDQVILGLTRFVEGLGEAGPIWLHDGASLTTYDAVTLAAISSIELEIDGGLSGLFPEGDGWLAVAGAVNIEVNALDASGARISQAAYGAHFKDYPTAVAQAPDGSLLIGALWSTDMDRFSVPTPYLLSIPSEGCVTPELPRTE